MQLANIPLALLLLLPCCGGKGGADETVDPPHRTGSIVIHGFRVEPAVIRPGTMAVLVADYALGNGEVDHGVGPVRRGVATLVSPRVTTTYTLTVRVGDDRSVKQTVTLQVDPPGFTPDIPKYEPPPRPRQDPHHPDLPDLSPGPRE